MDTAENSYKKGLTSVDADERIKTFGFNKIDEKKISILSRILKFFISPISLMLLAAALLSFLDKKYFDCYFIILLIFLNFIISYWQERKSDNAIEQLNNYLKVNVHVLRDGKWSQIDSEFLVPDDIVEIYMGDIITADIKIFEEKNFSVNEASVTGESLPVEKKFNDLVYSGSFVTTGKALASVTATGINTYFGKTILSLEKDPAKRSLLEQDILSISKFLSLLSFLAVIILTSIFLWHKLSVLETLTLDLSLIIAGVPIALPTVMALIMSLGVLDLAKKNVVVRRLASLEDLANVDLLFTDKTGTLTINKISIDLIIPYNSKVEEVLLYAFFAAIPNVNDLINQVVIKKAEDLNIQKEDYKIMDYELADSIRKRGSVLVEYKGKKNFVIVGAAQIIESFCKIDNELKEKFKKDIENAALQGYRVLAVAKNDQDHIEKDMDLIGIMLLSDNLRKDAKDTIKTLKNNGIDVRMLTGDHKAIAARVGQELGLNPDEIFSEVLPKDKYRLVAENKDKHIVAVTGDGINDLPAVKTADVGFAVSNAVGALKSTADIVLLSPGIAVINDAITEARKIFARIYSYSVYRISESFRVILTILILGILYGYYPLTPIQLILLALLNDIPIVSLAFNRVRIANKPAHIDVKKRLSSSMLYGLVGVVNSILFLLIMVDFFHVSREILATAFFLKLTVGGHLLVFVAHTDKKWYKFLPSKEVIIAVLMTQLIATSLTLFGIFMHSISWKVIIFTWIWAIIWMQVGDYTKTLKIIINKLRNKNIEPEMTKVSQ